MSKSTKESSQTVESPAKTVPKSVIEYVSKHAAFASAAFGVPMLPFILLYCERSDIGRKKVTGCNPLGLTPIGTEKRGKDGLCDFLNEAECFNSQARRWMKLDWSNVQKTCKELGLTEYTLSTQEA